MVTESTRQFNSIAEANASTRQKVHQLSIAYDDLLKICLPSVFFKGQSIALFKI